MHNNGILTLVAMAAATAGAQDIISARAGLIHHMEGVVKINGEIVAQQGDTFISMKQGETLSTEGGRTEILLNAGTYLRVGEDTAFRLDSADLESTRLTLTSGLALVEVAELPKETSVSVQVRGQEIALRKRGLYEFSADEAGSVKVYDGEVAVGGPRAVKVGKGRELHLSALAEGPVKFDTKVTSSLYNWGSRRAIYISAANQAAARTAYSQGYRSRSAITAGLLGSMGPYGGIWIFNSYLGMYTYLPLSGFGYSPFGLLVYSPQAVYTQSVRTYSSGFDASTAAMPRQAVTSEAYSSSAVVSNSSGVAAVPVATAPAVSTPNEGGGGDAGRRR